MPEDNITIPFSSFKKLVKSFGEELLKRSPDADRATEPLDMPFLDHMLELQLNHTNTKEHEENAKWQDEQDNNKWQQEQDKEHM